MIAPLIVLLTVSITGDSHAAGQPGRALADLLRARGHVVLMDGRVGARANTTRWRCEPHIMRVAFLGSNEMPSARTRMVYEDLQAIIIGPPRSRRARVRAMAELLDGARIRRYASSTACTDPSWTVDGLHYTVEGARRWAGCILPRVLELLEASR